ncbi:MAG: AAA family ATPase [Candidatus Cryosericum sp.]
MASIDEIDVNCLRGITSSSLHLDGKWLYILGENGTGKSSFIDALEYFFTGGVEHLQGTQGISIEKHLHHVNHSVGDMSVTARFHGNPACEVTRQGLGSLSPIPEDLNEYFESALPGTFVLRRKRLLDFISAAPADRFRALDAIIGIESLDAIELNMKRARDEMDARTAARKQERSRLLAQTSGEVGTAVADERGALAQVNALLSGVGITALRSFSDESAAIDTLMLRVKNATLKDDESRLDMSIQAATAALSWDLDFGPQISVLETARAWLATETSRQGSKYIELFRAAKSLFGDELPDEAVCPLCGQNTNGHELLNRVDSYLNDNATWTSKAQTLRVKSGEILEGLRLQAGHVDDLIGLLERAPAFTEILPDAKLLREHITGLSELVNNVEHVNKPVDVGSFVKVGAESQSLRQKVLDAVTSHIAGLKLSEEDQLARELLAKITTVNVYVKQLRAVDVGLESAEAGLHVADAVYECFKLAKQGVVREVFDHLHSIISSWYTRLHPDDEHGNVSISVDPVRRASAKLLIDSFGERDQDPRAYTSEGHLDSLGLVIFLAFAKEFQGSCNLLILDDVVSSVDIQHRLKICDLLTDEFRDWQVIVTTHDQLWMEELWRNTVSCGMTGNVVRQRIVRWSRTGGPVLAPFLTPRERIDERLDNGDKEAVGNQGRIYLEDVLKNMCEKTAASLRYRDKADFMAGELLEGLSHRIEQMTASSFKTTFEQRINELRGLAFLGNILSHENQGLGLVSINEVTAFWSAVKALDDAFVCPGCGKHTLDFDETLSAVVCHARCCEQTIVAMFRA